MNNHAGSGEDVLEHLGLYRTLWKLTELTGDRRYEDQADEALDWWFMHTQSPTTGLYTLAIFSTSWPRPRRRPAPSERRWNGSRSACATGTSGTSKEVTSRGTATTSAGSNRTAIHETPGDTSGKLAKVVRGQRVGWHAADIVKRVIRQQSDRTAVTGLYGQQADLRINWANWSDEVRVSPAGAHLDFVRTQPERIHEFVPRFYQPAAIEYPIRIAPDAPADSCRLQLRRRVRFHGIEDLSRNHIVVTHDNRDSRPPVALRLPRRNQHQGVNACAVSG